MEGKDKKQKTSFPQDNEWHRKATLKDLVFILLCVSGLFTFLLSKPVGLSILGVAIVCMIICYFIPDIRKKRKMQFLRGFSTDSTDDLFHYIRNIYRYGIGGTLACGILFGMFFIIVLSNKTSDLQSYEYILLFAVLIMLIVVFSCGPYYLLIKKILPQLKVRL